MANIPPILQKILKRNPVCAGSAQAGRRFFISFSVPVATVMAIILACVIAWAFFMGFMVGRGQNPETRIQAMTGILGDKNQTKIPDPIAQPESINTDKQNISDEAAQDINVANAKAHSASAAETPAAARGQKSGEPAATQFSKPKDEGLGAWETKASGNAGKQAALPRAASHASTQKQPKAENVALYDYSYQAAAYKNQKDAERLISSLKQHGLRASVKKSGKVFLVTVSLRGSEADASRLRQKLQSLKLGKPLMLSKKSVSTKNSGKGKKR